MLPDLRELGVEDRNGDGVMDYIGSRIYVADDADADELAAAANLAARLAFETVSMDLPLAFPVSQYQRGGGPAILVGRAASHLEGEAAIRLPRIEDGDLRTTLDDYVSADTPPTGKAEAREVDLSDFLASTRQIVLGPDVRSTAVIDLAARVALESTELRLPLVVVARNQTSGELPRNAILVGLTNPYVQHSVGAGEFPPPREAKTGKIAIAGVSVIIAGADGAGENAALQHAALTMPYLRGYGKGRESISSIENDIRRYCPERPPVPKLIFENSFEIPWEVDDLRKRLRDDLSKIVRSGDSVDIDLRLSETPEIRRSLASEVRELLNNSGADLETSRVRVRSAHKQGFFWIDEELKPLLKTATRIQIRFRELQCGEKSVDSADRWLHELYPIDEILARDLGLSPEAINFERTPSSAAHTYELTARDAAGNVIVAEQFETCWSDRPLFDLFPDYGSARVATGSLRISVKGQLLIDERIKTDYERFWDEYQKRTLPEIHDYILRLHDGNPKPEHAPHFDELTVEVQLSEPDFRIGIDEERISTLEALHEDIYFETLLFFDVLGAATCGRPLKYPGRIIPRIQPARSGTGFARIRLTGYDAPYPHNKPFESKNPSVKSLTVKAGEQGVVAVEAAAGSCFCWLPSMQERETITPRRAIAPLAQWNEPIGPGECQRIIEGLASFPEVRPFLAGRSWLGHPVWAMDVTAPIEGRYFSETKASATKPCLFITGRQHANEVSSTSHILKLVELLATDRHYRKLLDRVDFIIQPITNPDGAALVEELHKLTPDFMLHAGYLGALGVDVTDDQWAENPRYPEARIRADLWRMWKPDVVLNPHGYPSHEWVQLFAGYTAWVRSRHVQARDWWIPRGWFMPRFDFVEDGRFPQHRRAALMLRDRIAEAIRSNFGAINDRMYRRYTKYLHCELDLHNGVMIQSPSAGCKADPVSFGFMTRHPEITFFEGLSEVPDEVASGEWLRTVASAGLEFSLTHARFLAELPVRVVRTRWKESDTDVLRVARQRLPL